MARGNVLTVILLCLISQIHGHSRQFQLLRSVLKESMDSVKEEQKNLKGEILAEVNSRIVPHIRRSLQQEVLSQVRREIQAVIQARPAPPTEVEITDAVRDDIHREIRDTLNGPWKDSIRDEFIRSLREQIQTEIHTGLAKFLRKSLKEELTLQMKKQVKEEVQSRLIGHLTDSLKQDVIKEIEKGGPLKVQTKLTPYQRRILKQSIMKEVKVEVDKSQKGKENEGLGKEDILKEVRKEINRVHQDGPQNIRKDDIMKDIRKEIVKSHQRKDVQRMLRDGIMKEVRKEMEKMNKAVVTTEDPMPGEKKMREYIDEVTEKVLANSNELGKDLTFQEKAIEALTKRVHHLERKHIEEDDQDRNIEEDDQDRNVNTHLITNSTPTPSIVPEKENRKGRHKKRKKKNKKKKIPPPKKEIYESAREVVTEKTAVVAPGGRKDPGEEIFISTRSRANQNLPERDSLLVAKQNHTDLYYSDLTSGANSMLKASFGKYVGDLSYDIIGKTMYWTDWRIDAIYAYSVLKDESVILKPNILSYGIEVDTQGRVIVCSDYWSRSIFTMDIDMGGDSSRSINQVTKISQGNPMRIALDVASKRIYVSVSYTKILQVNYDNGRIRTIVEIERGFINSLGLNPKTKVLYFNNFTSVMGKNVTRRRKDPFKVSHITGKEPSDLTVHNGDVYISYYNSNDIDVIREGTKRQVKFSDMPFDSTQHLRGSLCFVPAH